MAIKKSELYSSLWESCDELRGGMDASQYKDYVLVLLFIKYVSDKYAGQKDALLDVPKGGSFADMVGLKGDKEIGDKINKIISRFAEKNDLKGVIDVADFNDADKLGKGKEMVDRLSNLVSIFDNPALNFQSNRVEGDDILGDAYEYLMRHFATESGKSKGQFYTPAEVSRIMAKVSFPEMAKEYLEVHAKPHKRSWKDDAYILEHLTLPEIFGRFRLDEITAEKIAQYKAKRATEVSPARVNRELAVLKTLFNRAIEWGKSERNPVCKVKFFAEDIFARKRYLEKGQIQMLLDSCPGWLRQVALVALNTGMRQGEILNLTWSDVDLERRLIYIRQAKSGPRVVNVNNTLAGVLMDLKSARLRPDSAYLFCGRGNQRMSPNMLLRAFTKAVWAAGIANLRFHDLRHTFASQMAMSGVDLKTVGELLGHKSMRMTERYAHLSQKHKAAAVARLDGIFAGSMDTNMDTKPISVVSSESVSLQKALEYKAILSSGGVA